MDRITNAAGSTFRERAGGGNFVTRTRSDGKGGYYTETLEGVWLPSGTGEANMGSKGTVDASIAGSASVQAGSSGSSRALNIV